MRKDILKERRMYKNELVLTETVMSKFPNSQAVCSTVKELSNALTDTETKLNSREYAPNILKDLFPNSQEKRVVKQTKALKEVDQAHIIHNINKKEKRMNQLFEQISTQN
jgi:hypothetical protein